MRFKVDENLPAEVAESLSSAGHDAVTVASQGLGGSEDLVLFEACRTEGRALVTLDQGFGNIRRYPPAEHEGVILLRLARQDKSSTLRVVAGLIPLLPNERVAGRLWIVEERGIRVRGG